MNQPTLSEQLMASLQGEPMQRIAQQIGADPERTTTAVSAALPLLMGSLGRNAAQPQGAEALFGALQRDHASGDLASVLGNMLNAGKAEAGASGQGGQILRHILGNREQRAEMSLGAATGLGTGSTAVLLRVLAPVVLSFLAQRFAGSGPADLGQALGSERDQVNRRGGGFLDSLLDQDGDGQVDLGDLLKVGSSLLGGRR